MERGADVEIEKSRKNLGKSEGKRKEVKRVKYWLEHMSIYISLNSVERLMERQEMNIMCREQACATVTFALLVVVALMVLMSQVKSVESLQKILMVWHDSVGLT